MSGTDTTKASKFMSLVLRHDPAAAGVDLNAGGWADVGALIAGSNGRLNDNLVRTVVETSDKGRFALSEDGRRIRARQGHSVPVDLGLEPTPPPATLYHGTVVRFMDAIMREGLRRGERQHVHLSPDRETAATVGRRRGEAVVLSVNASAMHAEGHAFFVSENGEWLTDVVPARFLSR